MVTIRLSRRGHKNLPFYRVIAVDSRKRQSGRVLEILGTYNPKNKELKVDKKKIDEWIQKGSQLSATVKKLLKT